MDGDVNWRAFFAEMHNIINLDGLNAEDIGLLVTRMAGEFDSATYDMLRFIAITKRYFVE